MLNGCRQPRLASLGITYWLPQSAPKLREARLWSMRSGFLLGTALLFGSFEFQIGRPRPRAHPTRCGLLRRAPQAKPRPPFPGLLLIYTIHPSSRALLTAALKAWERNSLIAEEVMCGPTQLRVSFSVGLSALWRYATMKSVPGLVTIISLPSNLTLMSMMKPYHTKKPRHECVTAPGLPGRQDVGRQGANDENPTQDCDIKKGADRKPDAKIVNRWRWT